MEKCGCLGAELKAICKYSLHGLFAVCVCIPNLQASNTNIIDYSEYEGLNLFSS